MRYFLFSFSVTLIIYLMMSFIWWDILWIKNLPLFDKVDRFAIVLGFIFKEYVCILIYDTVPSIKKFLTKQP